MHSFSSTKNYTLKTTIPLHQPGLFAYFSFLKNLVSDNVASFKSKELSDMSLQLGIHNVVTGPYYHNPCLAERANKNIKVDIKIFHFEDKTEWDKNLHFSKLHSIPPKSQ